MVPIFELADQTFQRQVIFWIGTDVYWGRVATFVSVTSVILLVGGNLPAGNGSILGLTLLDTSEAHTYQAYKDQIQSMIKDLTGSDAKLTTSSGGDIEKIIARSIGIYNRDKPWLVSKKVTGNATKDYVLSTIFGSLWTNDYSSIDRIESPLDQLPAAYLEPGEYTIHDDGTAQDGTNLKLRFYTLIPPTTEFFNVRIRVERVFPPAGVANYPDTMENFTNITTLSAALACAVLAAVYAPSVDQMISLDNVQHNEKTRKYMELAKMYREQYNLAVFGTTDSEKALTPAFVDHDVDLESVSGNRLIFHGGRNR